MYPKLWKDRTTGAIYHTLTPEQDLHIIKTCDPYVKPEKIAVEPKNDLSELKLPPLKRGRKSSKD